MDLELMRKKYASISDAKLIKLASEPYTLPKESQKMLQTELKERNIDTELIFAEPISEESIFDYNFENDGIKHDEIKVEMVDIAYFDDYNRSLVAQTLLESNDILAFVSDANQNRFNFLGVFKSYGNDNRLRVSSKNVLKAIEILKEGGGEEFLKSIN